LAFLSPERKLFHAATEVEFTLNMPSIIRKEAVRSAALLTGLVDGKMAFKAAAGSLVHGLMRSLGRGL
jgi:hypothetical protein